MACYGFSARAQVRESRNFLYLYSDSVVYARDIKIRPDFSGNLRVRVDSRNVPIAQVKFLNNEVGFFANIRRMGILRRSEFAERIIEGRINVFQERSLSYAPFTHDGFHAYETNYVAPSINVNMYYNKGYTDLKKLSYVNLKNDMADNPKSMDMLYAYKRSKNKSALLYVAGAVSILAGGIVFSGEGKNAYSMRKFYTGVGFAAVGVGLIGGGYFTSIAANGKLEAAVDLYNR